MASEQALLRTLRETTAVVIHPDDEDGRTLCGQLKRIGCRTRLVWPAPNRLAEDADVVFYLVHDDPKAAHPWLGQPGKAVLIGILAYENPVVLEAIAEANVHAVLTKPIRPFGILANLFVARTLYKYEERLLNRIAKLDETLKSRRVVERATKILSDRHAVPEDEAYALIRREAMRKQLSVSAMAESIVNAETIYGGLARPSS